MVDVVVATIIPARPVCIISKKGESFPTRRVGDGPPKIGDLVAAPQSVSGPLRGPASSIEDGTALRRALTRTHYRCNGGTEQVPIAFTTVLDDPQRPDP